MLLTELKESDKINNWELICINLGKQIMDTALTIHEFFLSIARKVEEGILCKMDLGKIYDNGNSFFFSRC